MNKEIKKYMSDLGKKSWEARKKKYNIKELMSNAAKSKKGMKYKVKSGVSLSTGKPFAKD